jgi:hypothetical protein
MMQAGMVAYKVLWNESRTYGKKISRFMVTLIRSMLVAESKWTHALLCETDLAPTTAIVSDKGVGVMSSSGATVTYSAEVMMVETSDYEADVILVRKAMGAADKHFAGMDAREIS